MGTRKIADYTITRKLGQGGMGTVYEALSPEGATVAVKTVLWPEAADPRARWEAIERFQREARAARSLSHPSICQVLDFGAHENSLFIVMEFLDGDTVQQLIDLAGPIELQRAVQIVRGAAEGLAHAHDRGIIHRDIKPGNIMALRTGQVKLTDFGLASLLGETGVTTTGQAMGTLAYMSPEQVRGDRAVDARSDIFSLGATFYEMVTGARAFAAQGPAAVMQQILTSDPPPTTDLPVHVSRTLDKCLRKKPEERFQTTRELIASLGAVGPVPASGPTAVLPQAQPMPAAVGPRRLPRVPRALRRWPVLAAATAALLAVGALALFRPWARLGGQPATTQVTAQAPAASPEATPSPGEAAPGPAQAIRSPEPPLAPESPKAKEPESRENVSSTGKDLSGADLRSRQLMGADLTKADLRRAKLSSANLAGASLASANLTGADLTGAVLFSADLTGANLSGANLTDAVLLGARGLQDATFSEKTTLPDGAKWQPGADLTQFTQPPFGMVLPEIGDGQLPPPRH